MRFEDERYVRLYTKNTPGWCVVPWQARATLPLVMRVLDRAGIVDLGGEGFEALAALVMLPLEVVETGMSVWIARGTFEVRGSTLVMPKFLEAQEATASNAQRQREKRARARDRARSGENDTKRVGGDTPIEPPSLAAGLPEAPGPPVEPVDGSLLDTARVARDTQRVGSDTPRHAATLCAVPSRTVPSRAEDPPLTSFVGPPAGPEGPPRAGSKKHAPELDDSRLGGKRTLAKAEAARGSRLPPCWSPNAETMAWCTQHGVDAAACLPEFHDYWRSIPGQKGVRLDWNATFRNRVRDLVRLGRAPKPPLPEWGPPTLPGGDAMQRAQAQRVIADLTTARSIVVQPAKGTGHGRT